MSTTMHSLIRPNQIHKYPTMTVQSLLEMLKDEKEDNRIFIKSFRAAGYSSIIGMDIVPSSNDKGHLILALVNEKQESFKVKTLRYVLKCTSNSANVQVQFSGVQPVWYDIHYATGDIERNTILVTHVVPANEQPNRRN